MATSSLKTLAWDFPVAQTEQIRKQLLSFLLSHKDVKALQSLDDGQNRLLLHPRIHSENDLPSDIVQACQSLDGRLKTVTVEGLSQSTMDQLWTVLFFSGSKSSYPLLPGLPENWRQVLSNFYPSTLQIDGKSYPTVEHFFQSQKALSSTKPEMAEWFSSDYKGEEAVEASALAAKKAGGRKAYKENNATLDISVWESRRIDCMHLALTTRYNQDELFKAVLDSTKGMVLLHFERSGARSFWGGNFSRQTGEAVGENHLGKLMMEIRDQK